MKNILNQLGDTASNLDGATPQEMQSLGMNSMGPAVQGPMATNPMMPTTEPAAIPATLERPSRDDTRT